MEMSDLISFIRRSQAYERAAKADDRLYAKNVDTDVARIGKQRPGSKKNLQASTSKSGVLFNCARRIAAAHSDDAC